MNQSPIFIRFKETTKIEKAILHTQINTDTITKPNDKNAIYNEKLRMYLLTKAQQFLQYHNKSLEYKESQIYTLTQLPRYIYFVFITKTNTNHPYLLYINLDDIHNTLNFLIPNGRDQKQTSIVDYIETINICNIADLSAIYILLDKTIYIRKYAIINLKFNLLDCENITNCIKKMHSIDKQKLPISKKNEMKLKYNDYYLNKAIEILKKYFNILDAKDYNEALLFLKGDSNRYYKSKYFGKERLNTFFKNTKTIIGHLEIFIAMYELFHQARMRLLKY